MRTPAAALILVLTLLVAGPAPAQSLGDLARKEKERRDKIQTDVKVITTRDSAKYGHAPATTESLPPATAKPDAEAVRAGDKPKADKQAVDEPTDLLGRPESFWKQTFADARKKVKDLEDEERVLQLKIADLQNKFYREDDGFKQQQLQRDVQKSFYEQDLNKENLAKAKAELRQLEIEARKSGALPGWIDGRHQ